MRSFLLGAVAALGICPAFVSAAVTINMPSPNTVTATGADQTIRIEVFGTDDGTVQNLNGYTIAVQGAGTSLDGKAFGSAQGVRFSFPANGASFGTAGRPTVHPYVFKDLELPPPVENFGSTGDKLQFASTVVGGTDEQDIDAGHNGFISMPIVIPANAAPGTYTLSVVTTSLGSAGAPIASTAGTPATLIVVPEPASLGLVALGGLFALRRRRVA